MPAPSPASPTPSRPRPACCPNPFSVPPHFRIQAYIAPIAFGLDDRSRSKSAAALGLDPLLAVWIFQVVLPGDARAGARLHLPRCRERTMSKKIGFRMRPQLALLRHFMRRKLGVLMQIIISGSGSQSLQPMAPKFCGTSRFEFVP